MLKNVEEFIKKYKPITDKIEKNIGICSNALLSQIALETGWGKHILKVYNLDGKKINSNNIFNIKYSRGWIGKIGSKKVLEFKKGIPYYTKQWFRVYDNIEEAINDYIDLIKKNSRYNLAWDNRKDCVKYPYFLKICGYATDPKYDKKIIKIMNKYIIPYSRRLKI